MEHALEMVVTLALILTFSPGEKEQPLCVSGYADGRPANPIPAIQVRRRTGERTRGASGGESSGKGNAGRGSNVVWRLCTKRAFALSGSASELKGVNARD